MSKALDRYAINKEKLTQMTSDEVKLISSALHHLSLAHIQAGNQDKAYEYLSETDHIFQQLGIKDTIDAALNDYHLSSILISQERFLEAEKYLDEVNRICQLLSEDPEAKSLRVQSWYLLAQVEGQSSQDKALELYNAILENISDVKELALPSLLPSVHREMGEIYQSRGEIDKMIKSWENGLQTAIKYFGEDSMIAFNFAENLAFEYRDARGEPYAEDYAKMTLKIYPYLDEKVAESYANLGDIYHSNGKYSQAVNSYNEAFKIYEKLPEDYSDILYNLYFDMTTAQASLDDHQQASHFLSKADQTLIKVYHKPNLNVAAVYCGWASDLNSFGMSIASREYYQRAIELYKTLDPSMKGRVFSIYSKLGQIAYAEGNWNEALEIWKEAEEYLDQTDARSVQMVYFVLESIYSNLGNHEESAKCLQKVMRSCEDTGNTSYIFSVYYETGEYFEKMLNWKEALECYEAATRVYEKEARKDPETTQNLLVKISQIKERLEMK